ncbi:PspC domain-containing protein [Trujillonella endophytica]|nr:PspC domain-containing protein [Trujillella endophytica]
MTSPVPPPAPRPTLRRGRTDTMLGGVCRGLADATGVDVVLWRVGFLALALTGAGLLIYPLLWVVLPVEPLPAGARPAPLDPVVERLHTSVNGALSGTRKR